MRALILPRLQGWLPEIMQEMQWSEAIGSLPQRAPGWDHSSLQPNRKDDRPHEQLIFCCTSHFYKSAHTHWLPQGYYIIIDVDDCTEEVGAGSSEVEEEQWRGHRRCAWLRQHVPMVGSHLRPTRHHLGRRHIPTPHWLHRIVPKQTADSPVQDQALPSQHLQRWQDMYWQ